MSVARTTINEVKTLLSRLLKPTNKVYLDSSPRQLGYVPRPPTESHARVKIPLKSTTDEEFRYTYIDCRGSVRLGRLLEDLDHIAGWIAYRHNSGQEYPDGTSPLSIVTACVDNVQIYKDTIPSDRDLFIYGSVTWTGSSSMEISMHLAADAFDWQPGVDHSHSILDAKFVMVARGSGPTGDKAKVFPLDISKSTDKLIYNEGELNKRRRIEMGKADLLKTPPNTVESDRIHKIYLNNIKPDSASFTLTDNTQGLKMSETNVKSCIVCQPEHRNVHNKIFGGFLMRNAMELGEATFKLAFQENHGCCIDIADIQFKAPVEIGSLLMLNCRVIATRGRQAVVLVHADVVNPESGEQKTTNIFYFIFESTVKKLENVIPETYGESLLFIDGERRLENMYERHRNQSGESHS